MNERIGVVGLGYVGLPVALAMAMRFPGTVGFDVNTRKINDLQAGRDTTGQFEASELSSASITFTADPAALAACTFIIVAVPTPIDAAKRPDLTPLIGASRAVGKVMQPGTVVVFESTVYPGVTEESCLPILAQESGLIPGTQFNVGYSPERINPGDTAHTFTKITKVVAGDCPATLERVAAVYAAVVTAGVYRATSIKVAEAAKVIENTQRDLNIALMNELALIFDRLGIPTRDVLEAAGTKWNFLKFTPGLVGGHCIGVDPYYLTSKAEQVGYIPQVILSGRRINDSMGAFIAQKTVKLLVNQGRLVKGARIGVLGLTFKENVPDLRNSRVPDIIRELESFGTNVLTHDPHGAADEAAHEYGITLSALDQLHDLDALVLAVSHQSYLDSGVADLRARLRPDGVFIDVKSAFAATDFPPPLVSWRL